MWYPKKSRGSKRKEKKKKKKKTLTAYAFARHNNGRVAGARHGLDKTLGGQGDHHSGSLPRRGGRHNRARHFASMMSGGAHQNKKN
jgi:hypothetical protein